MARDIVFKEKKRSRIGAFLRETRSELKKVSWPSFGKVAAQTGVVLTVVLVFLVVIFAIDLGLAALFRLLITTNA